MPRRRRSTDEEGFLSPLMLQILLVLSEGDRHGYAMLQTIEERCGEPFRLGPATLYRSLKRLLDAGFIGEVDQPGGHAQRRSYRITEQGRERARREARRLRRLVDWAQDADLLGARSKG